MHVGLHTVLVSCALAACSTAGQAPTGSARNQEADRAALANLRARYAAAFNAADAPAVATVYATDAVLMPPGEPALSGRAAVENWFRTGFDQYTMKADLASDEFVFLGSDWALDRGKYLLTLTRKSGGASTTTEYKYLTLLHREPDGWKAKRDIYNGNQPGT